MSYTQYIGVSHCQVEKYYDLESHLDRISLKITDDFDNLDENVKWELEDLIHNEIKDVLRSYIVHDDDSIRLVCESEEQNSNSMVWEYLIQEYCSVMTSEFMEIVSTSIDSRSGVSSSTTFYNKFGEYVDLNENILKNKNKIISVREQIQEDIRTYFGDGLKDEIIDRLCQIVVENFKKVLN